MSLRPLFIALGYALFGALWILFSDQAIMYLVQDSPRTLVWMSMLKGWLFVAVTAVLLWTTLVRTKRISDRQADDLQASEARYRLIVETASEGIEGIDPDQHIVFTNPARARMLGYTPEEMIGMSIDRFIFPEDLPDHHARLDQRKKGMRERYERRLRHKDGSAVWVIVSVAPWLNAKGEFLGSYATFTDITQRKIIEGELCRSRQFLYNVVDNIADPIFVKNQDHRFLLVNQALCDMVGISREGMLGHTDLDFFPKEQAEGYKKQDRFVMETGQTDTTEEILTSSDGKEFTVVTRKNLYVDDQGQKHIVGVIRDITDRNQALKALRQSEETFRKIFENSSDAILLMTRQERFTACNQACLGLLGLRKKDELVGKMPTDFSPERQPDGSLTTEVVDRNIEKALTQGVCRVEWMSTRADGSPLLLDVTVVPVTIDNEQLLHLTCRDITETKRMQELMIQTEKMMSVGGLAAGMAHEINNPLSGILQSVQVIKRRLQPGNRRNVETSKAMNCPQDALTHYMEGLQIPEFLETIQQAGERASAIVANMLEFSRKSQQDGRPADINTLVEKTVALAGNDFDLRKKYDIKKVSIVCELAEDLPAVSMIASEISQVLFNLIKNAVQALADRDDASRPTIWVRTRRHDGKVILEVEDNGPGVSLEHTRRIFEPFFTTKEPGGGTGLGLSVSYYIVTTHHGGSMRLEQRPGGGARFVVELPI